jgi:hypothetical protein
VLVVLVVDVRVRVLEGLVLVLVVVARGQVKPHARPHEDGGERDPPGERLMEQAPVTSRADASTGNACDGFHDSTAAPPAMAAMPRAIRASKFSRKTDQARSAVKTLSRFSRSED